MKLVFLRFHLAKNEDEVYVNANKIQSFRKNEDGGTRLRLDDCYFNLSETVEEVKHSILNMNDVQERNS